MGFRCARLGGGAMDGETFLTWMRGMLVKELKPGDVVVMDNLPAHKGPRARTLIEAAGANLVFLPPYSPDFNPIEKAFFKLKALLRKAAGRTVDDLYQAVASAIDAITPAECVNYFQACGYDLD
ncbi:MAG: transposase [Maricaulis sp.]|nr:transposase [Maricaulis sp.]